MYICFFSWSGGEKREEGVLARSIPNRQALGGYGCRYQDRERMGGGAEAENVRLVSRSRSNCKQHQTNEPRGSDGV